jgi:CubicO group peptidase (beta-lactamase class C family)
MRRACAPRSASRVARAPHGILTLATVTLLGLGPIRAGAQEALAASVHRGLVEEGLVGVTWSLVTPTGVSVGAAGVRDRASGAPLRPHDRMQVGSVAKTMLATGILVLVTVGRLDLDRPVSEYLPSLRLDNPWASESPVLVRHLLDHTSGLSDARMWQVFTLRGRPDAPLSEGLSTTSLRIQSRPGSRFSYSNVGFLVVGMLIEAVTRERYERWLDRELLAPLGMTASTAGFVSQAADTALAMGHYEDGSRGISLALPVRPASQFTTTAADMALLARFLMGDGMVAGRRLVHEHLLRRMAVPSTSEAVRAGLSTGYALGLAHRERWGIAGKCHLGNIGTFRAILCLYPEHQRAFFASFNSDPEEANFDRIDSLLAVSLAVPDTPPLPSGTLGVNPSRWEGWYVVRPTRFRQFAYLDALSGVTRVTWDGVRLRLSPWQGTPRLLDPVGGALFRNEGRRGPTHVLYRTEGGVAAISDGLRTLEQTQLWRHLVLMVSALAGACALLALLVLGGWRSARAWHHGRLCDEPLRFAAAALAVLSAAPLLYVVTPFMAIGDPTMANVAAGLATGLLPIGLAASLIAHWRRGLASRGARLEGLVLVAALQWCVVLAVWGMLPLMLWR